MSQIVIDTGDQCRVIFVGVNVDSEKRIRVVWRDELNVTKDSATTVELRDPDGDDITPAPTAGHEGAADSGSYSFVHTYDQPGIWVGRLVTDDVITDAVDFEVHVNTTPFAS
jgi:hypothetical protein